jgi:hypothetical protein
VNNRMQSPGDPDRVLDEAREHASLRPFVEAYRRQGEELEGFYEAVREAGDVTLAVSTDWMEQLEEACRPVSGRTNQVNMGFGTRC